jgi:hypothetical protein
MIRGGALHRLLLVGLIKVSDDDDRKLNTCCATSSDEFDFVLSVFVNRFALRI